MELIKIARFNFDIKKSINILLVGYAFCLPISKAGINIFEVLIILLWIIEGKWKEKFTSISNNILNITILLLIFFSLVSIFWSRDILFALDYILKYKHFLIIFVIYTSFDKKYMNAIISAFLYGMLISEVLSYAIHFELITFKNVSPHDPSPFMSHMSYSTYIAFASIIIVMKFFNAEDIKYKLFYGIFFISITANLFINGGRTGQIIFIFVILVTFILQFRNKILGLLISISLLVTIYYTAYNISYVFHSRANLLSHDIVQMVNNNKFNGSLSARVALSIVGIDKFIDGNIWGSGIGNEMKDINTYLDIRNIEDSQLSKFGDFHNSFVILLVQLGFLGLIINLMLLYSLIKLCFSIHKYQIVTCAFVISFILFSLTHNTLHTMFPMAFFALFAGLFNKYNELLKKRYE